jgi:hypothetical protein
MKLINATPHAIMILAKTGIEQDPKSKTFTANAADIVVSHKIEASGILPRVAMANAPAGDINGIPLETVEFGDIEGLPDEEKGVFYIVSMPVLTAVKALGRSDCLGVGGIVHDKANGSNILGCQFLQK